MNTGDRIRDELAAAFQQVSNGRARVAELYDNARIIEDVGLSSLDLLDLRCEIEDRWQITIADDELIALRTIGDVITLIREHSDSAEPHNAPPGSDDLSS